MSMSTGAFNSPKIGGAGKRGGRAAQSLWRGKYPACRETKNPRILWPPMGHVYSRDPDRELLPWINLLPRTAAARLYRWPVGPTPTLYPDVHGYESPPNRPKPNRLLQNVQTRPPGSGTPPRNTQPGNLSREWAGSPLFLWAAGDSECSSARSRRCSSARSRRCKVWASCAKEPSAPLPNVAPKDQLP